MKQLSIPQITDEDFMSLVLDKRNPVGEALSCHDHHDFECLHSFGYHGLFIPSVSEVLAQIPEEALKHFTIDAFEIIDVPNNIGDLNKYTSSTEAAD